VTRQPERDWRPAVADHLAVLALLRAVHDEDKAAFEALYPAPGDETDRVLIAALLAASTLMEVTADRLGDGVSGVTDLLDRLIEATVRGEYG
jgi:hypothetical protein